MHLPLPRLRLLPLHLPRVLPRCVQPRAPVVAMTGPGFLAPRLCGWVQSALLTVARVELAVVLVVVVAVLVVVVQEVAHLVPTQLSWVLILRCKQA